jgi:hypothetical protein
MERVGCGTRETNIKATGKMRGNCVVIDRKCYRVTASLRLPEKKNLKKIHIVIYT